MGQLRDPFKVFTGKPVRSFLDQYMWLVCGGTAADGAKSFRLASVFRVSEIGEIGQQRHEHYVRGAGHAFDPPVPIGDRDWFVELRRVTGHFWFGPHSDR